MNDKYLPTIGIECHVQLKTKTKLFAAVSNDSRTALPNTTISPICLGLPGTLPVLNEAAVELGIRAGLALNGKIAERMKFDRKHYFYPDLPKGYQITQYDEPIIGEGYVEVPIESGVRSQESGEATLKVIIERAHLEEDAGKSTHPDGVSYSLVDLNRAGTPLLEIVSKPDMHSAAEARAYAHELYLLMKYADVSDVDLYHGNMRFDVNISLAKPDSRQLGVRTEIKNLNSFRSVEKAVEYEIDRQTKLLEKGENIVQETRGWNETKQKTFSQRTKEEAHDYRYFPEPDIPPITISESQIEEIKKALPPLPAAYRQLLAAMKLNSSVIATLLEYPHYIRLIEEIHRLGRDEAALFAANLVVNVWLAQPGQIDFQGTAEHLVSLYKLVKDGIISASSAKILLPEIHKAEVDSDVAELAKMKNLIQQSDATELEKIVTKVIEANPAAADDVKKGEMKAIGFLVGAVMEESKGQANPQIANELLRKKLS